MVEKQVRVNQTYYDPHGVCVTIVDIYWSYHKDHRISTVALIERPSGTASNMSLEAFLATYSPLGDVPKVGN